MKSNDPGDPEQTFDVAANGAKGSDGSSSSDGDDDTTSGASESSGCSVCTHTGGTSSRLGALGIGLGVVALVRRRRSAR